jgi:hypothetical protein
VGGRAGFVATQAIRDSESRKASLDYVVDNAGVIFDAVSVMPWSGDAVVHVSIVNWVKGSDHAPDRKVLWLNNGQLRLDVDTIAPSLRPVTDVRAAASLPQNKSPKRIFQGQTAGHVEAFRLSPEEAAEIIRKDAGSAQFIHPVLGGRVLLHNLGPENSVIDLPHTDVLDAKVAAPGIVARLQSLVLPPRELAAQEEAAANEEIRKRNSRARVRWHNRNFLNRWWQHCYRRDDMVEAFEPLQRYIGTSRVAAEGRASVFHFIDTSIRPDDSMTVIALDDDYSLGIVSSGLHRAWLDERCSKLKSDLRYTSTTVWDSFPWPSSPSVDTVREVAQKMAAIVEYRAVKLAQGIALVEQYDALRTPGKSELRDLHSALDIAVIEAYGFNPEEDLLAQLLALNLAAAADPEIATAPGGGGRPEAYTTTYRLTTE